MLLLTLELIVSSMPLRAAPADATKEADKQARIAAIDTEMEDALNKVKTIVNQPVSMLQRTPDMRVSVSSPGWFHDGAIRPDFSHVDVRQTQDISAYSKAPYVTSDLNPGWVFLGSQLEFNPMTKYFYANRTIPKKRLTEAEMVEINRLYRIIGKCEEEKAAMAQAEMPAQPAVDQDGQWTLKPIPRERYILAGVGIVVVVGLYILVRKFR